VRSPLAGSVVDTAYLEAGRRAATSALGEDDRNITTASLSEAADWIGTGSWIGPHGPWMQKSLSEKACNQPFRRRLRRWMV